MLPFADQKAKLDMCELISVFRKRTSAQWMLLWLVGVSSVQEIMLTYFQAIFKKSMSSDEVQYNAGVIFTAYLVGMCASMLPANQAVELRLRTLTAYLGPATCFIGAVLLALL